MGELKKNVTYCVELCSGERRRWQYLGIGTYADVWWRDMENGKEFNEATVMYAWTIISVESPKICEQK